MRISVKIPDSDLKLLHAIALKQKIACRRFVR